MYSRFELKKAIELEKYTITPGLSYGEVVNLPYDLSPQWCELLLETFKNNQELLLTKGFNVFIKKSLEEAIVKKLNSVLPYKLNYSQTNDSSYNLIIFPTQAARIDELPISYFREVYGKSSLSEFLVQQDLKKPHSYKVGELTKVGLNGITILGLTGEEYYPYTAIKLFQRHTINVLHSYSSSISFNLIAEEGLSILKFTFSNDKLEDLTKKRNKALTAVDELKDFKLDYFPFIEKKFSDNTPILTEAFKVNFCNKSILCPHPLSYEAISVFLGLAMEAFRKEERYMLKSGKPFHEDSWIQTLSNLSFAKINYEVSRHDDFLVLTTPGLNSTIQNINHSFTIVKHSLENGSSVNFLYKAKGDSPTSYHSVKILEVSEDWFKGVSSRGVKNYRFDRIQNYPSHSTAAFFQYYFPLKINIVTRPTFLGNRTRVMLSVHKTNKRTSR